MVLDNSDGRIQVRPFTNSIQWKVQQDILQHVVYWEYFSTLESKSSASSLLVWQQGIIIQIFPGTFDNVWEICIRRFEVADICCVCFAWKHARNCLTEIDDCTWLQFEKDEIRIRRTVGLKKDNYQLQKKNVSYVLTLHSVSCIVTSFGQMLAADNTHDDWCQYQVAPRKIVMTAMR